MSFGFYWDAKNRIYYLPQATIESYRHDNRPHILPQGMKKYYTKDRYVVYFQHPYQYPLSIQRIQFSLSSYNLNDIKRLDVSICSLPRDLNVYLLTFFDKSSLACLSLTCKYFKSLIEKPELKNLSLNALRDKHLRIFLWSRILYPPKKLKHVCYIAAEQGDLPLLIKLHSLGYPLYRNILFRALHEFKIVKWLEGKIMLEHPCVFEHAAAYGNEEMFNWAVQTYGRIKGHYLARNAAKCGSISMLQMIYDASLLGNSCPYHGAVEGGHIHVLEWLKKIRHAPPHYFELEPCLIAKPHLHEWFIKNWRLVPM